MTALYLIAETVLPYTETGDNVDKTIKMMSRWVLYLFCKNNSLYPISVSGYVNYWIVLLVRLYKYRFNQKGKAIPMNSLAGRESARGHMVTIVCLDMHGVAWREAATWEINTLSKLLMDITVAVGTWSYHFLKEGQNMINIGRLNFNFIGFQAL